MAKRRGVRFDSELDRDIENFQAEMHLSSWSEANRQLVIKGLKVYEKEKREAKYS